MAAINCKCGNSIKFGEIPNPNESLMISDIEYDSFSGLINAEELYKKMTSILKCTECGRLWFFFDGFENRPSSYIPE